MTFEHVGQEESQSRLVEAVLLLDDEGGDQGERDGGDVHEEGEESRVEKRVENL